MLCAAANWLTAEFGMVPLVWGLAVAAGTFSAGLVLLLRDVVHDHGGLLVVFVCIAAGGALSWMTSGPGFAVASVAAFTLAELADLAVYAPLRRRGWGRAAFLSGVVGSVVDTVLFLWLAPLPLNVGGVSGQVAVKVAVTAAAVGAVVMNRAVFRDTVDVVDS
jgi:uncharacterized PurR-regulated membrane protein YhhQ (DUF165 family)